MTIQASRFAIALAAALVATTAMTPLASAQDWQHHREPAHVEHGRGHDDTAAWLGLGIAAFAGAALIANAAQAPQPVYAPAPAYVQAPTCTTINGYAACIGPDGNWQYVR